MTKEQIEAKLKLILAQPASLLFVLDGQFCLYSPIGKERITGIGSTIQQAIFDWEHKQAAFVKRMGLAKLE